MNTKTTLFSLAALAMASTGIAKADVFSDIEAAVPGSTVKLTEDVYYIELHKCITLDLNGHTIDVLHLRNQTGTITVKNGHIGNEIDGESGAGTAYCGTTVLEDLKVDGEVWVDGHTCYIRSGTYHSVNNHHAGDRFGTVYISGNNTYVQSFNGGGWDYSGGEVILLGGTYPQNPLTDYSRVFVDPSRTVKTLSSAPAGAPDGSYLYQVYDNGTPGTMGVDGNESEPNDDYMCANYIAPTGKITGQLSGDDEEDWFKVVIPEEGSLRLTLSREESLGIHHTALHVIDGNNQLQQRNYNWYDGEHLINDLAPGPYYICLRRNAGAGRYTLQTTFTPCSLANDAEVNDDPAQAQFIQLGKTVTGRLGYCYWQNTDEYDWYQIKITTEGRLTISITHEETLGIHDTQLNVYDASGELKERSFNWYDSDHVINNLAAGTCYIRVRRNSGYGGYQLTTKFEECSYSNDAEPNDEVSKAQIMTLGSTVSGRLGYCYWDNTDEYDWYQTEVTTEGRLTISITHEETLGIHDTQLNVYDASGELKERSFNWYDGDHIINNLAAGTCYIRVRRNSGYGGYQLTTKFEECSYTNDAEPNDEVDKAQTITLGKEVSGRLGYTFWDKTDDYDWYQIKITTEGRLTISITHEETLGIHDTQLNVYDDSVELKERSFNWYDSDHVINDLAAGTYYIRVRRNSGYGGYKLSTSFEECSYTNDSEPNNDYVTAQSIHFNNNYSGRLGYYFWNDRDEEDWYRIELASVGNITITVVPQEGLGIHHTSVHAVKDSKLEEVSYKWYDDVHVTRDLEPGIYYICVKRNSGYGGYTLSLDTTAGIEAVMVDPSAVVHYDLMGRQLSNETNAQGIVIRNGEKVIFLPGR